MDLAQICFPQLYVPASKTTPTEKHCTFDAVLPHTTTQQQARVCCVCICVCVYIFGLCVFVLLILSGFFITVPCFLPALGYAVSWSPWFLALTSVRSPVWLPVPSHPPLCTAPQVYQASGPKLIQNLLQGFNATMIAYGQTGSGKTFTMEGTPEVQ